MSKMIDALKVMAGKDLDENKAPGIKKPERKFFEKISKEQPEIVAATDPEAQKLEATSAEPKKAEKSEKAEKAEVESVRLEASDRSDFVDLVAYSSSDDMKSDLIAFFKGGEPSEMLVKLTDAVNGVTSLSAPAPVKSDSDKSNNAKESVGSESYKLEYRFLDAKTGATRMAQGEALLKSGVSIDDIESYNLLFKVFRINSRDELIDEGDDEDYKKVKAFLKSKN